MEENISNYKTMKDYEKLILVSYMTRFLVCLKGETVLYLRYGAFHAHVPDLTAAKALVGILY